MNFNIKTKRLYLDFDKRVCESSQCNFQLGIPG